MGKLDSRSLAARLSRASAGRLHRAVLRGAVRVPPWLALKHQFHHQVYWARPGDIRLRLRIGTWRRPRHLDNVRAWFTVGGEWKSVDRELSANLHGPLLVGGDWDVGAVMCQRTPTFRELIVEHRPVQETSEYERLVRAMRADRHGAAKGLRSEAEIVTYLEELRAVYLDMTTHGYRTQRQLGRSPSDEIRLAVGRHGELMLCGGGGHRLNAALDLGLARVPVSIRRIHADFAGESDGQASALDRLHLEARLRSIDVLTGREVVDVAGDIGVR